MQGNNGVVTQAEIAEMFGVPEIEIDKFLCQQSIP